MGIEYMKLEPRKVTALKANIVNTEPETPKKKTVSKKTTKTKTE